MAAQEDPAEQPEAPQPDAASRRDDGSASAGGIPAADSNAGDTAPTPPVAPSGEPEVPPAVGPATVEGPGVPHAVTEADLPPVNAPTVPGTPPVPPDATTVEPPRWAARASVPSRQAGDEYEDQWAPVEPPRSLVLPVLVTVIVMLLLGVFGVGIWLLLSNRPTPLPPEPPAETSVPTTIRVTTPVTTTTSASPTANTVPMPDIVGKNYADAAAALAAVGLVPDRHDEFSDTVAVGIVIGADKPKDTPVAPGTVISVRVSKGPQPTATATASPTASVTATAGPKNS